MARRKDSPSLFSMIVIPVALIIVGAFALSLAAVIENMRFNRSADQMLEWVSIVRTTASGQKGFAQIPGEDLWDALDHVGQTALPEARKNPWHNDIRIFTVANGAMRIETEVPTRDCRRLALYFLNLQPTELGLLALQAQNVRADPTGSWLQIYPATINHKNDILVDVVCGYQSHVRFAAVFRIR